MENGSPLIPGIKLIELMQKSMDDIVTSSCEELVSVLRRSKPLTVGENAHRDFSADLN